MSQRYGFVRDTMVRDCPQGQPIQDLHNGSKAASVNYRDSCPCSHHGVSVINCVSYLPDTLLEITLSDGRKSLKCVPGQPILKFTGQHSNIFGPDDDRDDDKYDICVDETNGYNGYFDLGFMQAAMVDAGDLKVGDFVYVVGGFPRYNILLCHDYGRLEHVLAKVEATRTVTPETVYAFGLNVDPLNNNYNNYTANEVYAEARPATKDDDSR